MSLPFARLLLRKKKAAAVERECGTRASDKANMIYLASQSKPVVFFVLIIFFIFGNCWWFLGLPHHPDLYDRGSASSTPRSPSLLQSPYLPLTSATGVCDLSHGSWIPDTRPPLYTNDTCTRIHPAQNCLQNARPDKGYLNWRWKPEMCELPLFDAADFLHLMRGKRLVIIGDSIARNHMQSLQCALSQVESPQNLYADERGKAFTWHYPSHNFTLANIWSPFLVNHSVEQNLYKLYLDVPDLAWTLQLRLYNVAIISTGYWYFRPSLYCFNNTVLGANSFSQLNVTVMKLVPTLKIALRSVFEYIAKEYEELVMLRTVTVDHFEHGSWNDGGVCNRTSPYAEADSLPSLPWMNSEINKLQIEEFEKAAASSREPWRFNIMNITYSAFLRPDGHPGPYRIQEPSEPVFDCLHWCLPGPIDMWNQLVLHTLHRYSLTKIT